MNKKRIISWLLFLAWLLVIYFFSSQTGEESSQVSNGILKIIENMIHIPLSNPSFAFIFRKLAHFTEYLILGILTLNLFMQYRILTTKLIIISICFCFLYASSDEFHQSFVGGRAPQVMDVGIDTLGSLTGIALLNFLKRKQLNNNSKR